MHAGKLLPCVETTWPRNRDGYGTRYAGRKNGRYLPQLRSNRVALEQKLGRSLRPGMQALHQCDNPSCIEPEHLYEGTASQNMHDMHSRDRHPRNGGRPRLPESVQEAIRDRHADGLSQRAIAAELGIGQGSVSRVLSGAYL